MTTQTAKDFRSLEVIERKSGNPVAGVHRLDIGWVAMGRIDGFPFSASLDSASQAITMILSMVDARRDSYSVRFHYH